MIYFNLHNPCIKQKVLNLLQISNISITIFAELWFDFIYFFIFRYSITAEDCLSGISIHISINCLPESVFVIPPE